MVGEKHIPLDDGRDGHGLCRRGQCVGDAPVGQEANAPNEPNLCHCGFRIADWGFEGAGVSNEPNSARRARQTNPIPRGGRPAIADWRLAIGDSRGWSCQTKPTRSGRRAKQSQFAAVFGHKRRWRAKTKPVCVGGRAAIGDCGLGILGGWRTKRTQFSPDVGHGAWRPVAPNKPNSTQRGVGGHVPPYKPAGKRPGTGNVKRSQFGWRVTTLWRRGKGGDMCKLLCGNQLRFSLCPVRLRGERPDPLGMQA